jgi:hypothetical protein
MQESGGQSLLARRFDRNLLSVPGLTRSPESDSKVPSISVRKAGVAILLLMLWGSTLAAQTAAPGDAPLRL